jgi:hypothetical protein
MQTFQKMSHVSEVFFITLLYLTTVTSYFRIKELFKRVAPIKINN